MIIFHSSTKSCSKPNIRLVTLLGAGEIVPFSKTLLRCVKFMSFSIFGCFNLILIILAVADPSPIRGSSHVTVVILSQIVETVQRKKAEKATGEFKRSSKTTKKNTRHCTSPFKNASPFRGGSLCPCGSVPHSKMSVSNGTRW